MHMHKLRYTLKFPHGLHYIIRLPSNPSSHRDSSNRLNGRRTHSCGQLQCAAQLAKTRNFTLWLSAIATSASTSIVQSSMVIEVSLHTSVGSCHGNPKP